MAKIHTETVIITLNQLIKNSGKATTALTDELIATIENVVQELVGDSVIVEINRADE